MGIPNKRSTRSGLSGHSSGSHPEIFQMTQDEFADHVTWDAEKPRLIVTENYLEDSPPHAQFKTSDKDTDGSRHTSTDG